MAEINREIEIGEGIQVELRDNVVFLKLDGKEISKELPSSNKLRMEIKDNNIIISGKKTSRRESAVAGTIEAHIRNLMKGLVEEYVYKLEICNVHFPMNVKHEGNKIVIKNFLGEKRDRISILLDDVNCTIKGNQIELKSKNKESVGQSAANLENATKVSDRDRRVFQDGIFIIEKAGREI